MNDTVRTPGKTTIAPDVLVSIARLTTLGVPGVSRLSVVPSDVNTLFNKNNIQGVRISVVNDIVYVDLYVVLNRDVNVRDVSHSIQNQVARAINEMVGMEVGKINVHIEDIDISVKMDS
jgi:uncharacterized alkaline shock family protein YloU